MNILRQLLNWISSLKFAICLLLLIGIASALGTAIPQGEVSQTYFSLYKENPWLGVINPETILLLHLDNVYSSNWFLSLLTCLGISLISCSWKRQWPTLKSSLRWIDYKKPEQLKKLAIAQTVRTKNLEKGLKDLAKYLQKKGWVVKESPGRLAARKGVLGRVGPPLVHIGLVLLMLGSAWSALQGQRFENFLIPQSSFDLSNQNDQEKKLSIKLNSFEIERDPAGRTEQFTSKVELLESNSSIGILKEVSVNHPLRFKGITIYQADWALSTINLKIGSYPNLQLPLKKFPELGDAIWGLVLPTKENGGSPVLLSVSSELGPVRVFDETGSLLASLRPGGEGSNIKGIPLKVIEIIPSSGLLLKRDPGVPLVYSSFALVLLGSGLSVLANRQLWAVQDSDQNMIYIGGLCNRNLSSLAKELPIIVSAIVQEEL